MGDLLTFGAEEILKQSLILVAKQIIASREFKKVLETLQNELLRAEWILDAIKTKHDLSRKDFVIANWVNELQLIVYEAEDMLDLFAYEDVERKVRSNKVFLNSLCTIKPILDYFSLLVFGLTRTKKMKEIINVLSEHCTKLLDLVRLDHTTIAKTESEFMQIEVKISTLENYVVDRKKEVESIVQDVIEASKKKLNSILPVYGMGGSGKTTLAQMVFNDERIKNHFQHTVWIYVPQPFDINEILYLILQKVHRNPIKGDRETLIRKLKEVMSGRSYFLVFDNVWNENKILWETLKACLMSIVGELGNSSVLVTTRSREIAEMMKEKFDTYHLNKLSDDQCWSIFSHFAKANEVPMTSNLKVVREKVVQKIGGLPLLAKVLGGAAQFSGDSEKWVKILNSILTTPVKTEESLNAKFILKLSVDRLPKASIKQCFAYCSNFPKGYWFGKKQLIQMWMAQGFIRPDKESNETMEDTGERYFNILLSYCLFQDIEVGRYFDMHDLVHDIACDISSDKKLQLDRSISSEWKALTKENKIIANKLRTIIDFGRNGKIVDFVCLRVLTITVEHIFELPNSISKLKHLRYLDISCCRLVCKLPESIVVLYNLQTLKLFYLRDRLLPTNLRQMVNLRHLEFRFRVDDLHPKFEMPPYLSELVQLQTLFGFVVGFKKGCKITELGGLTNLKGLLMLHRLERVESKEEAKAAKLVEKEKVEELHLVWSKESDRIDPENQNDLEVLEGLEPHKNLKHLEIQSFLGVCLPKETFVENLVTIILIKCRNCEKLPMIGQLSNLEFLIIAELPKVKSIGNEFYGNYNDGQSKSSVAFPKLTTFMVEAMDSLVEWKEVGNNVKAFPRLECLKISRCAKLVKIPDVFGSCDEDDKKHLKFVDISFCNQLKELSEGIQSCQCKLPWVTGGRLNERSIDPYSNYFVA